MAYYGYHQQIKKRIRAGELVTTYRADNYHGIGEALVLVFNTAPFLRPIRPEREAEYELILEEWRNAHAESCSDTRPA